MTDAEKKEKKAFLKEEIRKAEFDYYYYKALQLALKLVLNGTYGAFANPHFVASNKFIANAITSHGRDVILYMLTKIEEYVFSIWHTDIETHRLLAEKYIGKSEDNKYVMINVRNKIVGYPKDDVADLLKEWHIDRRDLIQITDEFKTIDGKKYEILAKRTIHDFSNVKPVPSKPTQPREAMKISETIRYDTYFHEVDPIVYGDTDSSFSKTIIVTSECKKTIENFYNDNIKNGSAGETLNGHESVFTNDLILNYSKEKGLYYSPVKRIIRHKVTKEKWQLKTKSGKEIFITNDHSLVVFRDGNQITVKPREVLSTDKILIINEK
jgi:DNA polymerase elongation subunit (family B)